MSNEQLIALINERARQETYLIQPLVANHPDVSDLSRGALSTVRIVTGVNPDGSVKCIAATYKLPRRTAITSTHGLNSPIDLQTGELGRAVTYRPLCPGYDQRPHTGARITGRFRHLIIFHDYSPSSSESSCSMLWGVFSMCVATISFFYLCI